MTQTETWTLRGYLDDVLLHVSKTERYYQQLCCDGVYWHPIPFSGDILGARVLTVGVNPSAIEFKSGDTRVELEASRLEQHLVSYFKGPMRQWHQLFVKWSEALDVLDVSYRNGTAAHLDLSPRATLSMGKFKGNKRGTNLFTEMLEADALLFFELLKHCHSARTLLLAGCCPRGHMNHFLRRVGPTHGFELRPTDRTPPKGIGFYRLHGPGGIDIPTFFSSASPNYRWNRNLIVQRVTTSREMILNDQTASHLTRADQSRCSST